jgi:hypothetical protein
MPYLPLVLSLVVSAGAIAQLPQQPLPLEQEIRQELDALGRAVVQRDKAAVDRLVADEFTFSQPNTYVSDKKNLLASVEPGAEFVYERHQTVDIAVRGYGIVAVSNGRFIVGARYDGQSTSHLVQFTAVHVRRDGRWQLVALHSTIKPDKK